MSSFKKNEYICKKEDGSYYVVSANKASSVTGKIFPFFFFAENYERQHDVKYWYLGFNSLFALC